MIALAGSAFFWTTLPHQAQALPQNVRDNEVLAQVSPEALVRRCETVVADAANVIEDGRSAQVVDIMAIELVELYSDYPADAPIGVILRLEGTAAADILSSSQFMNTVSDQVITQCQPVSLVEFQMNDTDWSEVYGLVRDEVVAFECVEAGVGASVVWGQTYCL